MTICIAAISNVGSQYSPFVLTCSDREMTGNETRFDSGTPKLRALTVNAGVMYSSSDSLFSIAIIERVRKSLQSKESWTISEIAELVSIECRKMKEETLERDVTSKFNFIIKQLNADPNSLARDAKNEADFYIYPRFDFIVFGLDSDGYKAHIHKINQDGKSECWDAVGFVAIGIGESLASAEMTKYLYSPHVDISYAIPRVYIAKKVSQRAPGVGEYTDFGVMYYLHDPQTKTVRPFTTPLSEQPQFISLLEKMYKNLKKKEFQEIMKTKDALQKIIYAPPEKKKEEPIKEK